MKYIAGSRRRAAEYERAIAEWWKKNKIFEQSVEQRPIDDSYVFYDGPPFITGDPHYGTLLSSIVKDAVPRFWTMRGKRVERRWGWDCHGLPAENFVEKQLGIKDRREIGTKWTLEEYITKARESMVANSEAWKGIIERTGRWVDMDHPYRTMNSDYMESVWWAFKQLYDAGKIYEGRKVLMYDTKFATPVSKAEVTMDNDAYQTVMDPSAYVKFRVLEAAKAGDLREGDYLLAWTTTPWTLPANVCLAVSADIIYGIFEKDGERFVVAKTRAEKLGFTDCVAEFSGSELAGAKYEPLIENISPDEYCKDSHTVVVADFVSDADGTGIVHIAPAYGEDDYALSEKYDLNFVDCLDENGYYLPEMAEKLRALGVRDTDENGIECWAGNKIIAKILEAAGKIWKIEYIQHEYPFNPRSKQRIMYRAFPSWFFDVQGSKALMLEQNENVNWFPAHFKEGRFKKNIEAAPDWNLSRDRFWASAMPVWKGDRGSVKVVGSYDELYELSGVRLEDYHRPWVDEVEFEIDGEHFKRIEKVLDCWFESGSMPFAQLHYPFENKEKFERNYPADFIVEYVGQIRAWFYYVHCVNTALAEAGAFGESARENSEKNAYKNVIVTGTLAGNDGRKMSKSLGNYTDPNELIDKFSADSLRFLLLSSPVCAGEDFALIDKDVSDVARKLTMIWNVYDFFTMYASVDGVDSVELAKGVSTEAGGVLAEGPEVSNPLDRWIIARVHQLRNEITAGMESYNLPKAVAEILPTIDDLSNWFVRRSRRRFWKSEDDADKMDAYRTLHYVLVYLSEILAPFTPFLAEELYQKMTGATGSVHLLDWPEAGMVDEGILATMAQTREVINEGLALRMRRSDAENQIKIRQPLAELLYAGEALGAEYEQMIADEVNVKTVRNVAELPKDGADGYAATGAVALQKTLDDELRAEGWVRELIRAVQSARKKAGLQVDDRIRLMVAHEVPEVWRETLAHEVLATELSEEGNYAYDEIVKVNGEQVAISLEKA